MSARASLTARCLLQAGLGVGTRAPSSHHGAEELRAVLAVKGECRLC